MSAPGPVAVDTNVAVVANNTGGESLQCALACVQAIRQIHAGRLLVLDDADEIFTEYRRNLSLSGRPGVGDEFMRWVHDSRFNPHRCVRVELHPDGDGNYAEFPRDASLATFDPSDRKFVAVAVTHPEKTPVLVAGDRGWSRHVEALAATDVEIQFLCGRSGDV
jgi:hypothetical protein